MVKLILRVRYKSRSWIPMVPCGPTVMFAILFVLFTYIIPIFGDGKDGIILITSIVLWNFFNRNYYEVEVELSRSSGNLLRKVNIPRYLLSISSTLYHLSTAINSLVIIVLRW